MEKKHSKRLALNRETVRELLSGEIRRVVGGDGSQAADSCGVPCGRLHIPSG
jgi:hypothetical protein